MSNRSRRSAATPRWALQDAKNKLSEVVEAAARGEPQIVTKRGVETAVVISYEEYQRIRAARERPVPPLADYLLEIPTSPEPVDEIERIGLNSRDTGV
jgi:prevent-host-death family protein